MGDPSRRLRGLPLFAFAIAAAAAVVATDGSTAAKPGAQRVPHVAPREIPLPATPRPSGVSALTVTPTATPMMKNHAPGDDNKVLLSARTHLVFWGSAWNATPAPGATPPPADAVSRDKVSAALRSIALSNYLDGAAEYSADIKRASAPDVTTIADTPPGAVGPDPAAATITGWITGKKVPFEPKVDDLYFVILPTGADTGGYGAGYHSSVSMTVNDKSYTIPFVVIKTDGLTIDFVSDTLSHELVEAVTNPFNSAVYGTAEKTSRTPDCSANENTTCEVADACDPGPPYATNDAKTPEGYQLSAYWLNSKQKCSPTP
jgi:hypothetical protein